MLALSREIGQRLIISNSEMEIIADIHLVDIRSKDKARIGIVADGLHIDRYEIYSSKLSEFREWQRLTPPHIPKTYAQYKSEIASGKYPKGGHHGTQG